MKNALHKMCHGVDWYDWPYDGVHLQMTKALAAAAVQRTIDQELGIVSVPKPESKVKEPCE